MKWEDPKLISLTDPQAHGECSPGSAFTAGICNAGDFPGGNCWGGAGYDTAEGCVPGVGNPTGCTNGPFAGGTGCSGGFLG